MKIAVIGTRGIPDIQGGVETHCEELYPRIAAMGHDVTVVCRSCYIPEGHPDEWRGVKLLKIKAPRTKSLEAIVHTWRALRAVRCFKPDVVHIHAIGPAILTPVARLMGMPTVTTNHGPDYDRAKWGHIAKRVLKTAERLGTRSASAVIAITPYIAGNLTRMYGRKEGIYIIPNGVEHPTGGIATDYIESLGLEPRRYVVALGRFVKEKGFHDLLAAWEKSGLAREGWQLAIAGDADHPDEYSRMLKERASRKEGVVLTGFIKGDKLAQLMRHAALMAMPSYHEGLPIALLEGMSYDLDVAVSNIPACQLPELDAETDFFAPGDIDTMAAVLRRKLEAAATPRHYGLSRYDWDTIARDTIEVYTKIIQ